MGLSWREHKGRKILVADYRGLHQDQCMAQMREIGRVLAAEPAGTLLLVDARGMPVSMEFMKEAKRIADEVYVPRRTRQAVIGIDGLKGILMKGFNKFVPKEMATVPFDSEQAAFDYLVS